MQNYPLFFPELAKQRHQQLVREAAQHRLATEAARARRASRTEGLTILQRTRRALGGSIVALGTRIAGIPALASAPTE
jgi:hypothetical protein